MRQEEETLDEISDSVTRYYDSRTDEEVSEEREWGEFAARQWSEIQSESI